MDSIDFKCKFCGGMLKSVPQTKHVGKCIYCSSVQTMPIIEDSHRSELFANIEDLKKAKDYQGALELCQKLIEDNPHDPEAYWAQVICKYGVEYKINPKTGKPMPVLNRFVNTFILSDVDYLTALERASEAQRAIYEADAEVIYKIQKHIFEKNNIVVNQPIPEEPEESANEAAENAETTENTNAATVVSESDKISDTEPAAEQSEPDDGYVPMESKTAGDRTGKLGRVASWVAIFSMLASYLTMTPSIQTPYTTTVTSTHEISDIDRYSEKTESQSEKTYSFKTSSSSYSKYTSPPQTSDPQTSAPQYSISLDSNTKVNVMYSKTEKGTEAESETGKNETYYDKESDASVKLEASMGSVNGYFSSVNGSFSSVNGSISGISGSITDASGSTNESSNGKFTYVVIGGIDDYVKYVGSSDSSMIMHYVSLDVIDKPLKLETLSNGYTATDYMSILRAPVSSSSEITVIETSYAPSFATVSVAVACDGIREWYEALGHRHSPQIEPDPEKKENENEEA